MNKKIYKYEKHLKTLQYIEDAQLFKAVAMSLYLIVDMNKPLKISLSIASNKHNVKPMTSIDKLVRQALPDDYFTKRKTANAPTDKRNQAAFRYKMLNEMESMARSHLTSILQEKKH